MAAVTTVKRDDTYKHFWDRYSDRPDIGSMMLNKNADELEESDRFDVLDSLPDVTGKDVVDIGAGIGRFTSVFAEKARHVVSTDFIESFILKNRERNAHFNNITFKVADAIHLELPSSSVDLVFTNWLLMYLSDSETLQFLLNVLRWLRPDGYVKLRESCSQPSTGRSTNVTLHSDANPTSYRFESIYIELVQNLRYRCPEGKIWRLDIQWSCSVPTYIKHFGNWRQVHWLAKKVLAEDQQAPLAYDQYLQLFSHDWQDEQREIDMKLDGERSNWSDSVFNDAILANSAIVPKNSTIISYNPRRLAYHCHINAHLLAERFTCNIWNVETNPYYYRTSLTKSTELKDNRVRFGWNENLALAIKYWGDHEAAFHSFLATELLSTTDEATMDQLPKILNNDSHLLLLEPADNVEQDSLRFKKILEKNFKVVSISEVTEQVHAHIKEYLKNRKEVFFIYTGLIVA
uniref:phosphoethanolamine N-methyltransferase n=1 Tax=Acrobeloides nanus TaxID=290746 RepID=A0A914C8H3_9BILA